MLMMPAHRVRITKPFYVGAHEVTVGQYRQFCEQSGYETEAEQGLNHCKPYEGGRAMSTWRTDWAAHEAAASSTMTDGTSRGKTDGDWRMRSYSFRAREEAGSERNAKTRRKRRGLSSLFAPLRFDCLGSVRRSGLLSRRACPSGGP